MNISFIAPSIAIPAKQKIIGCLSNIANAFNNISILDIQSPPIFHHTIRGVTNIFKLNYKNINIPLQFFTYLNHSIRNAFINYFNLEKILIILLKNLISQAAFVSFLLESLITSLSLIFITSSTDSSSKFKFCNSNLQTSLVKNF